MLMNTAAISEYDVLKDVPWLDHKVFGNSLHAYALAGSSFVVVWGLLYLARKYATFRLEKQASGQSSNAWDFARGLVGGIKPWVLMLVAFYVATVRLSMPASLARGLHLLTVGIITIQVVRITGELLSYLIVHSRHGRAADDPVVRSTNSNISTLVKIGLWTAGLLFFLDNAGFNVSTFIAGLGIGGVAIALAAQAILGDTFSSFAIALDKPFEVGDFITVDDLQGTVEHIGLKTTRVRSMGGELLVFANSDLTKSRIRNFKRMYQRRASFKLNVHPLTPLETLKTVPALLAGVVKGQSDARLERAHFASFSDQALIFEVVYYVTRSDYNLYMDVQQAINFGIQETFARSGIALAFLPVAQRLQVVTPVDGVPPPKSGS